MKKIIIVVALIISSGLTAYCLSAKETKTVTATTLKINTADFAVKTLNGPKSDLGTAD
jgi:outer membrane murein-binding lipoprotein Lpp